MPMPCACGVAEHVVRPIGVSRFTRPAVASHWLATTWSLWLSRTRVTRRPNLNRSSQAARSVERTNENEGRSRAVRFRIMAPKRSASFVSLDFEAPRRGGDDNESMHLVCFACLTPERPFCCSKALDLRIAYHIIMRLSVRLGRWPAMVLPAARQDEQQDCVKRYVITRPSTTAFWAIACTDRLM